MSQLHASPGERSSDDLMEQINFQKLTAVQFVGGIFCHICQLTFNDKKSFDNHYKQHSSDISYIVYTCVICHKEIAGYPSFRGHCYDKHVIKDKFKCQQCNKYFSKQAALQEHIHAKHIYKCSICQQQFPSHKEMNLHKYIHKSEKNKPPYKCLFCNHNICNTEECEDHIDQHSEISYSCPICSQHISSKGTASDHLIVHFGYSSEDIEIKDDYELITNSSIDIVGGIMCIYCKSIQRNKAEFLEHHMSDHGDQKIFYTCCICLKQHEKYAHFANHCYNHTSKEKNQCEICDKKFDRLAHLVVHMETSHSAPGSKPFMCSLCEYTSHTEWWLKEHLRTMHSIESFKCPEPGCGQTFDKLRAMILHQKVHKNVENFCNSCGLQFISLAACHRHLDLHCKTVFTCPVCNRKYAEKYLVKKHMVNHFELVMHLCNVCGKIFNAKNRLTEHMRVHTETKQHVCEYCGKAFLRAALLQQHVNIHLKNKPFKCCHCYKLFANYANLSKHLLRMHKFEGKLRDLIYKNCVNAIPVAEKPLVTDKGNKVAATPAAVPPACDAPGETIHLMHNELDEFNNYYNSFDERYTIGNEIKAEQVIENDVNHISFASDTLTEIKNVVFDANILMDNDGGAAAGGAPVPREYGPEFAGDPLSGFCELSYGDYSLPHIDPHLTTKETMFEPNLPYNFQIELFHPTVGTNTSLN